MQKITIPRNFNLDISTVESILKQVNAVKDENSDKEVLLDFKNNDWFSAELTTFLGAIISDLFNSKFKIYISELSGNVELILNKNGFLKSIGINKTKVKDKHNTTIPFYVVRPASIKEIEKYLNEEVFDKISSLSSSCVGTSNLEIMENAVFEVVHNITDHSGSEYVIMCGQYYPAKKNVVFTIADVGVSLPKKVSDSIDGLLDDVSCVEWAIQKGNSTKDIESSGLGLYDIKEEIKKVGSMHIISRGAYWNLKDENDIVKKNIDALFSGTLLSLTFNLSVNKVRESKSTDILF